MLGRKWNGICGSTFESLTTILTAADWPAYVMTNQRPPTPDPAHGSRNALPGRPFAVELLDSSLKHRIHLWSFESEPVIRIGRSTDNQVVIGNPYVSRLHATLAFEAGCWILFPMSDKGVFMDGELLAEPTPVAHGSVFRLAAQGPFLRCIDNVVVPEYNAMATISHDSRAQTLLSLDVVKRDHEVEAIAGGEYFRKLKALARELRERPNS